MTTKTKPTNYEKCGLTLEQFKRFDSACWSTYQAIGGDLGELDGGRSQRDQIDVILDAGYIRMYGSPYRSSKATNKEDTFEYFYDNVIEPMIRENYSKPHFMKMMKEIFPHKSYE